MIEHVIKDDLVVADLSDHNPNVFYELALRRAIRKPLVQIIEKGQKIPFDLANFRTIDVDHTDLESVDRAKDTLKKHIQAVESDPDSVDNPISTSMELNALRASHDPLRTAVADMAASMSNAQREIQALAHNIDIFDKLKTWDKISKKLAEIDSKLHDLNPLELSNIEGFYSLDDLMSKLEEIESLLEDS